MKDFKSNVYFQNMKSIFLAIFLVGALSGLSQKDSKIKIDTGSNNKIGVIQSEQDSSATSDIELNRTDSSEINVRQGPNDMVTENEKVSFFSDFFANTNNVLGTIASGLVITSAIALYLRKKRKAKL